MVCLTGKTCGVVVRGTGTTWGVSGGITWGAVVRGGNITRGVVVYGGGGGLAHGAGKITCGVSVCDERIA